MVLAFLMGKTHVALPHCLGYWVSDYSQNSKLNFDIDFRKDGSDSLDNGIRVNDYQFSAETQVNRLYDSSSSS